MDVQTQSGSVSSLDAVTVADEQAIIANQTILLTSQAALVRYLEDQLNITPPGQTPPLPPPPGGISLTAIIQLQTAAIRTQAAYTQQLQALIALGL